MVDAALANIGEDGVAQLVVEKGRLCIVVLK